MSPSAVLVAAAEFIDAVDLIFREGDSPNQLPLINDELCVEILPPGYPGVVQVAVNTADDSATRTKCYYTPIRCIGLLNFKQLTEHMCISMSRTNHYLIDD